MTAPLHKHQRSANKLRWQRTTRVAQVIARIIARAIIVCSVALTVLHRPVVADELCNTTATVSEIADGVYVRQGRHAAPFTAPDLANVGFIIGESCVAVIDSGASLAEGHALRCAIQATTEVPICYVVLTHHHFDHVMGSRAFVSDESSDVKLIAHVNMNAVLLQSAEYYRTQLADDPNTPLPEDHVVVATQSVSPGTALSLDLGGRTLTVTAHTPAHTNNDLSLIDDKTQTLWLSDLLFLEHIPVLDSSVGSITGWIDVLGQLVATNAMRVVPGHGPISVDWPDGAADTQRYLNNVRDDTRALIKNNGSLKEAEKTVAQSELSLWQLGDVHHVRSVIRAFTELEWE